MQMIEQLTPQYFHQRMLQLDEYACGWDEVWKDCADHVLPWRQKFLSRSDGQTSRGHGRSSHSDRSVELRMNDERINSLATWAVRMGAAGMMQGFTSPARPWYRTTTRDSTLAKRRDVKEWLFETDARTRAQLQRSNIYQVFPNVYESLLTFGPAAMLLDGDPITLFRAYFFPIGSYRLACDDTLRVDTFYRRVALTVRQTVGKFGLDSVSQRVRELWTGNRFDDKIDIIHAIEPNPDHRSMGLTSKRFMSVWVEQAETKDVEGFLHVGGYEEFPVMTPRWGLLDEDCYGYSPIMDAMGDVKQLQILERRKLQALDWVNRPLLTSPASLKISKKDMVPGKMIQVPSANQGDRIQAAYTVPPAVIGENAKEAVTVGQRVERLTHSDLWLIATMSDRSKTATEVLEIKQEKMQQLGGVVERVNDELSEPVVNRVQAMMLRAGKLPPPPDILKGQELQTEFISEMAMAQKMTGVAAIAQTAAFFQGLSETWPEVGDGFNADEAGAKYAELTGAPPDLVRTKDEIAEIRGARQAAQQKQAELDELQQQAMAAKDLAQAPLDGDNALKAALGNVGEVAAASAGGGLAN